MKKTYWWRVVILLVAGVFFIYSLLASYGDEIGLCKIKNGVEECIINYNSYIDSLAFYSLFLLVISPFLFLINDKIFLKWLRFGAIWIGLSILLIIATPESSEGLLSFGGPGKELVSIWLGALFVILSLAKISWDWKKEKN